MSGTTSTRWYFTDWMSDPALRACGYAARGLWIDLLSIAAANKGRDHGFVMLAGRKLEVDDIARMTNGAAETVEPLLAELKLKGVCSVDRRGIVYCRRMVRAEKNRTNGRLGGNPNLMKQKENPKPVGTKPKAPIPVPGPKKKKDIVAEDAPDVPFRLPHDWQPNVHDRGFATGRGLTGKNLSDEVAKFRNHWHSKGGRDSKRTDWSLMWETWVINNERWSGGSNGKNQRGGAAGGLDYGSLAVRVRQGQAANRAASAAVRAGDGLGDSEPVLDVVDAERR